MHISEILRGKGSTVVTTGPDVAVTALLELLREHNLGAVVVSADGRGVDGIVTERDVVRRLVDDPGVLTGPVAAIMTSEVHTCSREDTVEDLMGVMTEQRVRHLPVVDRDGRLVGIVSIGDLVKAQISRLQFERDQLEGYLSR